MSVPRVCAGTSSIMVRFPQRRGWFRKKYPLKISCMGKSPDRSKFRGAPRVQSVVYYVTVIVLVRNSVLQVSVKCFIWSASDPDVTRAVGAKRKITDSPRLNSRNFFRCGNRSKFWPFKWLTWCLQSIINMLYNRSRHILFGRAFGDRNTATLYQNGARFVFCTGHYRPRLSLH